jgi:proprotein convertase subtilisin/kexin type 5
MCLKCSDGYSLLYDKQECVSCDGCVNGIFEGETIGIATCNRCADNCVECSSESTCVKCREGYRLQKFGAKIYCILCNDNSETCKLNGASSEACDNDCYGEVACPKTDTVCLPPYLRDSQGTNTCMICDNSRLNGEFRDFWNNVCVRPCVLNCATCESAKTCLACMSGYGLLKGDKRTCIKTSDSRFKCSGNPIVCEPCPPNCNACAASASVCTACDNGYYIVNSKCRKCAPFCKTCTDPSVCTECEVGWFLLNSGSQCARCDGPGQMKSIVSNKRNGY